MMRFLQTLLLTFSLVVFTAGTFIVLAPQASAAAPIPLPQQSDQQLDEPGTRINTPEKLQFSTIAGWVYEALKTIGGLFAYLGGSLFDYSLSLFVMDMPGTAESLGIKAVIDEIWKLVRDIFNLFFIFGFIFAGFKLILGTDETGAKSMLGTIIVAALLINFSLYATKVVVDFGNILSVEMASLLKSEAPDNTPGANATSNEIWGIKVTNLSDKFVAKINPEQIVNNSLILERSAVEGNVIQLESAKSELDIGDALIMGLTTAFTLTLIGFVFAAGAILMLIRFFYLLFLMMFSPIMFLGFVLPNFKKRSSDWWHTLFSQTMIGPAYLFMLYIALKALENMKDIQSDSTLISYVLLCIVVCGFAWAALIVAKSLGAIGATQAISIGKGWGRSFRGYAGSASFGTMARIGRSQIGSRANMMAESDSLREAAAQKGWRGTFNRAKLGAARIGADASFDARRVGSVGKKLGLGEGRKGGYKTATEEIIKKEKAYADSLGTISNDDVRVMSLKTVVDENEQEIKKKKAEIQQGKAQLTGKDASGNNLNLTDVQKKDIKDKIEGAQAELEILEEKKKQNSESLSAEKQRIQLGTKANIPGAVNDSIKEEKNTMKENLIAYAGYQKDLATTTDESEKQRIQKDMQVTQEYIAENKKKIADLEKEANTAAGGYSSVVANIGTIKNFFLGRNKSQNDEAAKNLRAEYLKKVKGVDKST